MADVPRHCAVALACTLGTRKATPPRTSWLAIRCAELAARGAARRVLTGSAVQRMAGFNVLHPMGWDAFGLPAEQYAIDTGTHPSDTTKRNINRFREQLKVCVLILFAS